MVQRLADEERNQGPVVSIEEDGKTIVLAESGAIVEFLIERYGAGKLSVGPEAGAAERANYLYWIHWAEGTAMYPLMLSMYVSSPFIHTMHELMRMFTACLLRCPSKHLGSDDSSSRPSQVRS
jgi:hypothetical protein